MRAKLLLTGRENRKFELAGSVKLEMAERVSWIGLISENRGEVNDLLADEFRENLDLLVHDHDF